MLTNPSWKWLSSRLTLRELGRNSASPSRPCLPAVEQLDDRLMLSAAPSPFYQSGGHEITADTQILIGLIKGQLGLIQDELTAIKLAPGQLKPSDVVLMKESLLNMDQTIVKLGEDAVAGNLTDLKQQKVLTSIDDLFGKIISAIPPTLPDDNNLLLPAVQKVREAAIRLVTDFTQPGGGKISVGLKQQKVLLALPDEFQTVDELIAKFGEDPSAPEFKTAFTPDMKVTEEFVKIDFLVSQLDENLQGQLKPAIAQMKIDTFNFLNSLTDQPPTDFGGGGPVLTGGIVLTDTGDLLA